MRVIEVGEYGGPEVLVEANRPEPRPAAGTVRVRVAAATVNPVDVWAREGLVQALTPGLAPPFVLGWDFAGTVIEDAEGFAAGQRVLGLLPWFAVAARGIGTNAEVVAAAPGWLAPLPDGVPFADAAVLALNGPTAAQALALLPPLAGTTVLVTGASGGVGGFAVQLAAAAGADVLAVAAGADDEAYLAGLGAKQVLPRTAPAELAAAVRAVRPEGVDAVVDAGLIGQPVLPAVRDVGAVVSASDGATPTAERGIKVATVHCEPDAPQLRKLAADLAAGRLVTRVASVLPLADAAEAHRRTAAGGLRGKVVLAP